uniref:Uncharacterized protein n=2 Tax=Chenopodium quinoa TaxID=63459 RepID=A0A803LAD0_CHEQI
MCGYPILLWDHGADAFPYTFEKLQELRANDWPIWETPSTSTFEGLLGCSPSDFVYKNNTAGDCEQVTISELTEKVVALYLTGFDSFIPTLHKVYEHCRAQNLAFEIVLVYMPFDDCLDPDIYNAKVDSVLQKQNISWWRLPFNNSVSRRLKRLTNGPRYVELYGAEIIDQFGIEGFPFTREGIVESGLMRLRELTLDSLLVYGSRNYVIRGNNKIVVSELKGRNILLYLDYYLMDSFTLYHELLIWYNEIKANHPTFDVVFVRLQSMHTSTIEVEDESELSAVMPWLICPFDPDHSASLAKKIFFKEHTRGTLIQFGEDGRICSTQVQDLLRNQGPDYFPFGDNLRQDVICELQSCIHTFIDMM